MRGSSVAYVRDATRLPVFVDCSLDITGSALSTEWPIEVGIQPMMAAMPAALNRITAMPAIHIRLCVDLSVNVVMSISFGHSTLPI